MVILVAWRLLAEFECLAGWNNEWEFSGGAMVLILRAALLPF
jgi:hypothetical protein